MPPMLQMSREDQVILRSLVSGLRREEVAKGIHRSSRVIDQ